MPTKAELEVEIERLKEELANVPTVEAKDVRPLRGVRTNLNDAPAYIISVGDYQRLGGQ